MAIRAIAFLIFLTASFQTVTAQPFVQRYDGIPFNVEGQPSYAPFNGGMNNARYQFADIDSDGDKDLFTFDSDTTLYFYRNIGTAQAASYSLITTRFQGISIRHWFAFADIDSDGDIDLFAGGEDQSVKFYRNTGTPSNPVLALEIEQLRTISDTVIYSEANCVPTFCDIDNDGDLDFFTGQSLGTITYYENIGSQTTFLFRYVTDFWQNLIIISPALGNRHGANSIEFVDIDNDLDFDLFWGDLFSSGIYFIRNDGTPSQPNVVIVDSLYPHNSPYISSGYNSTRFTDIDGDGDKDMFISVLYLSQNTKNFTFYRNNGTQSNPVYERITDNYLKNVDVGGNSNIAFADIDGNGTPDLITGNDYAKLTLFRNTGIPGQPSFNLEIDSLPIHSSSFNYSPAFGDLDNDGDLDLILGSYIRDSIWLYRNTGTPNSFQFTREAVGNSIGITGIGQSSTPALVDIDNDGDLDLFSGATNGRIIFYQNTGTPNAFEFTFRTNFYQNIDAGDESIPRFADIDRDGDYDLFIGSQNGRIAYFRNDGSPTSPVFTFVTDTFAGLNVDRNSCPFFLDYDNDNDLDLFVGNGKGGIFFFRNDEISGISSHNSLVPEEFTIFQNYPNPFNPSTTIEFEFSGPTLASICISDISGRFVKQSQPVKFSGGRHRYVFWADGLPSGIYFFTISAGNRSASIRMLLVK